MQHHELKFTIEMPNGFTYELCSKVETDWDDVTVLSWAYASLSDFTFHSNGEINVTSATLDGRPFGEDKLQELYDGALALR